MACLQEKYPSKTKLCNGNFMTAHFSIHGHQTFITLYRQELTSPIASTEREPTTFRRQAWYESNLHNIVNLYCAVCIPISCTASSQNTQMQEIVNIVQMLVNIVALNINNVYKHFVHIFGLCFVNVVHFVFIVRKHC